MIKLLKGFDIRVRIISAEHKHHRFCGTVIGSYDGVYGVLLDTGEYADIPADQAQVIMVKEDRNEEHRRYKKCKRGGFG